MNISKENYAQIMSLLRENIEAFDACFEAINKDRFATFPIGEAADARRAMRKIEDLLKQCQGYYYTLSTRQESDPPGSSVHYTFESLKEAVEEIVDAENEMRKHNGMKAIKNPKWLTEKHFENVTYEEEYFENCCYEISVAKVEDEN